MTSSKNKSNYYEGGEKMNGLTEEFVKKNVQYPFEFTFEEETGLKVKKGLI